MGKQVKPSPAHQPSIQAPIRVLAILLPTQLPAAATRKQKLAEAPDPSHLPFRHQPESWLFCFQPSSLLLSLESSRSRQKLLTRPTLWETEMEFLAI